MSGYVAETISLLFESWLWHTGSRKLEWLINASRMLSSDELSEDDILLCTYHLASIRTKERDSSIWNILVLTVQNPEKMPDHVSPKTPPSLGSLATNDPKEVYFIRAIYQGKARSAWWISQYISDDRVWELLKWTSSNVFTEYESKYSACFQALHDYEKLFGYSSPKYDILVRCMAVLSVCIGDKRASFCEPMSDGIDDRYKEMLSEMDTFVGLKRNRLFTIPSYYLYGITARGRIKISQHNLLQINNVEKNIIGCPFWNEAIAEYGAVDEETRKITWNSDEAMENFYAQYFPEDIPDEWSAEEKKKSHGHGILGKNDKPNIWKYSQIHFRKPSHLAWGSYKKVEEYLEELSGQNKMGHCNAIRILDLYNTPEDLKDLKDLKDVMQLAPVKRIKCVY